MRLLSDKRWIRVAPTGISCFIALIFIACGSAGELAPTYEPGRVDIRVGAFGRTGELADANFSAVLPTGWRFFDKPVHQGEDQDGPREGLIYKSDSSAHLNYSIFPVGGIPFWVQRDITDGEFVETNVNGVMLLLTLPDVTSDPEENHSLRAFYPQVPTDGAHDAFSILFSGNNRGAENFSEALEIVKSVRVAGPPPEQEPPVPSVTPGSNWSRVIAHVRGEPESHVFSFLFSPGWTYAPRFSFDSFGGEFTNGETVILFDYCCNAGGVLDLEGHFRDPDDHPEFNTWEETVDDKLAIMFRPASPEPLRNSFTGMAMSDPRCYGSFSARTADPDEGELVLAILRTFQMEVEEFGLCR